MSFLKNELIIRALPDLYTHLDGTPVTRESWEARRGELRRILAENVFGVSPTGREDNLLDDPSVVVCTETKKPDTDFCAGKVVAEWFDVSFPTPTGVFSFPVRLFLPTHARKPYPLLLHVNFRPDTPDLFYPVEEITDSGFATAQIYYEDITKDNEDYSDGLCGHYPDFGLTPETRVPNACGKIRFWAFAASRLLDVLLRRDDINHDQIVIAGHSRLGKTAMIAAAYDDRFAGAISNESGCTGAAISRSKMGEKVDFITKTFPFWFCPKYRAYANREYEMPFDQHFLCALIAPRPMCIGSAFEDTWADPEREFLSAVCLSGTHAFLESGEVPTFEDIRTQAGIPITSYPACGTRYRFAHNRVQYHVRGGTHFFSREDWNSYISFFGEKYLGHIYD